MAELSLSLRYLDSIVKRYDGTPKGSSSLWASRMLKAYGILSQKLDHHSDIDEHLGFDYSHKQVSTARVLRTAYYKRLIRPDDISKALRYCPISLDIEIFNSIFLDQDGVITMPDEDDKKEEYSHCFTVLSYEKANGILVVHSPNWPNWGKRGVGTMPIEYLNKYFITAFAFTGFPKLAKQPRKKIHSRKFTSKGSKFYFNIFLESNFDCDNRHQLNFEVINVGGDLVGWGHFASDYSNKILEMLDLFVLEEFRRQGIASFIIKYIILFTKTKLFTGFISAQDLIGNREDIVKSFLLKNNFTVYVDKKEYKDSRFKIVSINS